MERTKHIDNPWTSPAMRTWRRKFLGMSGGSHGQDITNSMIQGGKSSTANFTSSLSISGSPLSPGGGMAGAVRRSQNKPVAAAVCSMEGDRFFDQDGNGNNTSTAAAQSPLGPAVSAHWKEEGAGNSALGQAAPSADQAANKAPTAGQATMDRRGQSTVITGGRAQAADSTKTARRSTLEQLKVLATTPVYVGTVFTLAALYFVVTGVQYWATLYLVEVFQPPEPELTPEEWKRMYVVPTFAVVALTGPALGVVCGGLLVDSCGSSSSG